MLAPQERQRLAAAPLGGREVPRGVGGACGRHQQFGATGCRPALALAAFDGDLDLRQRVPGEAGREQDGALGDKQLRLEDAEFVDEAVRVVEEGERRWDVAAREGRRRPLLPGVGVLQLLTGLGEQRLGPGVVLIRALDRTEGELHRRPVIVRARLPDGIAGAVQQRDRAVRVPQRLLVPTHRPQRPRPADQDATGVHPAAPAGGTGLHHLVQG